MRFQRQKNHVIDLLFPIAVLFVFAISSFLVLVLSAHIYSSQTQKMNTGYTVHTSLASVITAFFFALSIYPVSDGTSRAAKTARITSTTISSTNVNPRLRLFLST